MEDYITSFAKSESQSSLPSSQSYVFRHQHQPRPLILPRRGRRRHSSSQSVHGPCQPKAAPVRLSKRRSSRVTFNELAQYFQPKLTVAANNLENMFDRYENDLLNSPH